MLKEINAIRDMQSPVSRTADLRISVKSSSSPEKTPLSVKPMELGVESPERGRSSPKNPSTATIYIGSGLPVKSNSSEQLGALGWHEILVKFRYLLYLNTSFLPTELSHQHCLLKPDTFTTTTTQKTNNRR